MHTKKYRASPLTEKKNRTVSGGGKKIEQTENLPTPPIKNQMVRPLLKHVNQKSQKSAL